MITIQALLFIAIIATLASALMLHIIFQQRDTIAKAREQLTNKHVVHDAVRLINDERRRQQLELGYTTKHDDEEHAQDNFLINDALHRLHRDNGSVDGLVKAGALIAAEIDRRMRRNRKNVQARVTRTPPLQVTDVRAFLRHPGTMVEEFDYGNIFLGSHADFGGGDLTVLAIAWREGKDKFELLDQITVKRGDVWPSLTGRGRATRFNREPLVELDTQSVTPRENNVAQFDRGKDVRHTPDSSGKATRFDRKTDLLPGGPQC